MATASKGERNTRVYTTSDGQAMIEQLSGTSLKLSAEEILMVIEQLHACYDYCAAWKDPTKEQNRATGETPL
jgi:hypothetical protein